MFFVKSMLRLLHDVLSTQHDLGTEKVPFDQVVVNQSKNLSFPQQ